MHAHPPVNDSFVVEEHESRSDLAEDFPAVPVSYFSLGAFVWVPEVFGQRGLALLHDEAGGPVDVALAIGLDDVGMVFLAGQLVDLKLPLQVLVFQGLLEAASVLGKNLDGDLVGEIAFIELLKGD